MLKMDCEFDESNILPRLHEEKGGENKKKRREENWEKEGRGL